MTHRINATVAKLTGGLSPVALTRAYTDWAAHLWLTPAKQKELFKGLRETPVPDKRFASEEWQKWPYNVYAEAFLRTRDFWENATTNVPGVDKHYGELVNFMARTVVDTFSPTNFPWTNPEVLKKTRETHGMNFVKGHANFLEDYFAKKEGRGPIGIEKFEVGKDVAVTPGKVVYRNRLIELIQYNPTTENVQAEPILIVPAWIMKYYILDLSPKDSMVKYLVSQGFTVFMISWKNPWEEDGDLGLLDYIKLGPLAALDAINAIIPGQKVHAAGYCLGGTLLSIVAAILGGEGDERLASMTLFAAQTDFTEAGELTLFIDEDQLKFLEDVMESKKYLDGKQMAGAFQLLHMTDLLWNPAVQKYLLGERSPMIALMSWNADTTRMPYKMHAEYLRKFFLNNELAEGRYDVDGKTVNLSNIRVPLFVVGTSSDHVAPAKSVYKVHAFVDKNVQVTFVLAKGGHNAGIVSEPGHPRRNFQYSTSWGCDGVHDFETFKKQARKEDGSWWVFWKDWLYALNPKTVEAPQFGAPEKGLAPIEDAPGTYIKG